MVCEQMALSKWPCDELGGFFLSLSYLEVPYMYIKINIMQGRSNYQLKTTDFIIHALTYMPTFENQKSVQIMLFSKKRGTILTLLFNTTDKFVQEEEHLH